METTLNRVEQQIVNTLAFVGTPMTRAEIGRATEGLRKCNGSAVKKAYDRLVSDGIVAESGAAHYALPREVTAGEMGTYYRPDLAPDTRDEDATPDAPPASVVDPDAIRALTAARMEQGPKAKTPRAERVAYADVATTKEVTLKQYIIDRVRASEDGCTAEEIKAFPYGKAGTRALWLPKLVKEGHLVRRDGKYYGA